MDSTGDGYRDRRDSASTARSDASLPPPRLPRSNLPAMSVPLPYNNGNLRAPSSAGRSPTSPGEEVSPLSANAIAAFQHLMAKKKRNMTEDDYLEQEYEKEKQREAQIQMARQQRLRDRVPGRQVTKPRAGDIDGK